jgi:alkanesulfonate monooxygenase SsuD/methylene tetrahydromethanopterin reductase-like flavin-dependent oxidoreductase (luciferase family)
VLTDLVINPFGAHLADMLAVAKAADEADIGAVWVTDHFSGNVVDAPWSRDPFVCLGAIAAVTDHVDLGVLVANVTNRHAVQLASGINSLQSLAPGRVRLGVGSGAAPDSRFSVEHDMVGKKLGDPATRRAMLNEAIGQLRRIWKADGFEAVTDGAPMPSVIVGASSWATIEVAIELADGVNIRRTERLADQLERLAAADLPDGFEVSVLDFFAPGDELGVRPSDLVEAGVDRHIVTMWPGRDLGAVWRLPARNV